MVLLGLVGSVGGAAYGKQTIASAPALTSGIPHADQAACYVRNVGTKPVEVNVRFSGAGAPSFDNCNVAPLEPGRTYVVLKEGPMLLAECIATSSSSAKRLRGTVELRLYTPSRVWSANDLH